MSDRTAAGQVARRAGRRRLPGIWACTLRWLRTRNDPLPVGRFTYHRQGRGLVVGFTVFMAAEALITHALLLAIFGPAWWTWIVLAFGLYSAAWILGRYYDCMAVLPHAVEASALRLYCGNIGELIIPREAVLGAHRAQRGETDGRGKLVLDKPQADGRREARFSNGSCAVAIELDQSASLTFNGKPVTTAISRLYVNADNPDGFVKALARPQ